MKIIRHNNTFDMTDIDRSTFRMLMRVIDDAAFADWRAVQASLYSEDVVEYVTRRGNRHFNFARAIQRATEGMSRDSLLWMGDPGPNNSVTIAPWDSFSDELAPAEV